MGIVHSATDHYSNVQNITSSGFKELGCGLACVAMSLPFIATKSGAVLLGAAAVGVVAYNTLVRAVQASFASQLKKPLQIAQRRVLNFILTSFDYIQPISFSIVSTSTTHLMVHEGGHALAGAFLHANPAVKITFTPFKEGMTEYASTALSKLGNRLGRPLYQMIISGAGPMATLLCSLTCVGISHSIRKTHPTLSRYLFVLAIVSVFAEALYAVEAFRKRHLPSSHDFAVLAAGSIHPLASAVLLVALPLLFKLGLHLISRRLNC